MVEIKNHQKAYSNISVHNELEYKLILAFLYDCGFTWKMKEPSYKTLSKIYGDVFALRMNGTNLDIVTLYKGLICTDSKRILRKRLKK